MAFYGSHKSAFSTAFCLLLVFTCGIAPTSAQIPAPFADEAEPAAFDSLNAVNSPSSVTLSPAEYADLLRRLERTESQLQQFQAGPSESTSGSGPQTFFSAMQERFDAAKDPSITTVDEQTHRATTSDKAKKWYDRLSIRGYAQFRHSSTVFMKDGSAPPQYAGDRSVGEDQNFLIRRARLILSGDVSDHMYVYIQPDFANTPSGSPDGTHFGQIRDWYGDLYIDKEKVYRVRVGQSKVPYGWENLQSSSNRLALDRTDPINSAVRNERDLGVFFYWTPEESQDLFKYVLDEGLKGSGNYGVFALGAYNGQGGSLLEQNDNLHLVTRLTWPFRLDNDQIVELGVQAYTGKYVVLSSPIRPLGLGPAIRPLGTLETDNRNGIRDERIAASFIWYPQPLGLQAEWCVGNGPGLNDAQTQVVKRALSGGYVMAMYRQELTNWGVMFPFARWQYFQGGYKPERNAPFSFIDEWELGLEWQFNPQMELTAQYTFTDRTNTTAMAGAGEISYRQFEGHLLRFQFQINY